MTYKVGPKGQVVLPKHIRDDLGIAPGDEVEVRRVDGEIRIRRASEPRELLGILADAPHGTAALERERRLEREREGAKSSRHSR
ncbi:MAG TPA: AbrB/MazE/SpoVT family DNA-binding domain-containing protein [Solirubrobacteraceae bacterium]|nr:AbrB/MazE/SpoVT family DNA-binding domain-containing protein [Solirubrobacteraceae bacterium]